MPKRVKSDETAKAAKTECITPHRYHFTTVALSTDRRVALRIDAEDGLW